MSVQGFILRLEQERAGLIQSIFDYSNAVQQWRSDLVTLDAVLELLRSGEVPEVPTNTDPVGELPAPPAGEVAQEPQEPAKEEVVVDDEPAAEQPAPVVDETVGEPSEPEQAGPVPSAPAAEEPSEASLAQDATGDVPAAAEADATDEVSESADAPTTEGDTAR